jgi:hypothetical protein
MSKVKVYSFTVGRDAGFCIVTPLGLIQAERGQQVTIAVSETWEQGALAIQQLKAQDESERGE